jgi:hypothetical protein
VPTRDVTNSAEPHVAAVLIDHDGVGLEAAELPVIALSPDGAAPIVDQTVHDALAEAQMEAMGPAGGRASVNVRAIIATSPASSGRRIRMLRMTTQLAAILNAADESGTEAPDFGELCRGTEVTPDYAYDLWRGIRAKRAEAGGR